MRPCGTDVPLRRPGLSLMRSALGMLATREYMLLTPARQENMPRSVINVVNRLVLFPNLKDSRLFVFRGRRCVVMLRNGSLVLAVQPIPFMRLSFPRHVMSPCVPVALPLSSLVTALKLPRTRHVLNGDNRLFSFVRNEV